MTDALLDLSGLTVEIKQRHRTLRPVRDVTFSVAPGETVGLVGESGCGKTMTGLAITRLLPPGGTITSGAVHLEDRDLTAAGPSAMREVRGNEVGMVFQDPMTSLNPTMTIGRQIAEAVQLHQHTSRQAAARRAEELLALVEMPEPAERAQEYPHQLSGGMRQRAMIAMALSCEPKLLIADEPTTALDVTIQAQLLCLLDALKTQFGMAMLLISHDLSVIAERADRVLVMYAGRIVESGTTASLFERPRHPYTTALLASLPTLDHDTAAPLFSIPGRPPDLLDVPAGCAFSPRCLHATDECRRTIPESRTMEPGHRVACFHPRTHSGGGMAVGSSTADSSTADSPTTRSGSRTACATTVPHHRGDEAYAEERRGDPAALLELREVSKRFPVSAGTVLQRAAGARHAVSDVTLTIRQGETLGVVGESGCGKTTLARMAVALDPPTTGRVVFDGTDLSSLGARALRSQRRDLQLIFQDPYTSFDPRMRVGRIIAEPLVIQHVGDRGSQERRVGELLADVGLPSNLSERYPHELSSGQRQRVGFARALALQPRLIVADEPVSALDVSIRSQIINLMREMQALHGLTYMLISHDLSVVHYLADRIAVMYLGRIVEIGRRDDIYRRAVHPYTAGLLASVPSLRPVERSERTPLVRGELPSSRNPPSGCSFRTRCPHAQDRCAEEVPQMASFGADHSAACHFPLSQSFTQP